MRQAPWSRIREQNSVNEEVWETVGNVRKETIAVSDTIRESVQNRHSRILLRVFLRGRMREMHREPGVLEAEAQVGEWLDCRARINKELAPIHSVKSGNDAQLSKLRLRNFDARNENIETGAVVTSLRGYSGIERGKGICYQWKAKGQCSKGDQCSFRHESHDREKPTPKAAPPSEPPTPTGGSASRKGILRCRSPSGKFNRQPCTNFLKGTCTKLPCDCWHPPECQILVV